MSKGLIGKKIGMTQIYDDSGRAIPVTILEVGPCTVITKNIRERMGIKRFNWVMAKLKG